MILSVISFPKPRLLCKQKFKAKKLNQALGRLAKAEDQFSKVESARARLAKPVSKLNQAKAVFSNLNQRRVAVF